MGRISYGKFVFAGEELILDEYELVQLLKICELRNRSLYRKFVKFYRRIGVNAGFLLNGDRK